MSRRILLFLLAALVWFTAYPAVITQKSLVNGVTVAVTAGNLGPEATIWDFAVVLRAGNKRILTDDILRSAVLVDPQGRQYKALAWEGAASERGHLAGVLKFVAMAPRPDSIELRIIRPGERKPRSFSWLLGSGMVALASRFDRIHSPEVAERH